MYPRDDTDRPARVSARRQRNRETRAGPEEISLPPTSPDLPPRDGLTTDATLRQRPPTAEFPAVFFLDRQVFRHYRVQTPKQPVVGPDFPRDLLHDAHTIIHSYVSAFFEGPQRWLAVIPEERLRMIINQPLATIRADMALLLLCIRMSTSLPHAQMRNGQVELYTTAKNELRRLEVCGFLSTNTLEAAFLIALYEISHAIYPSAFLSVGSCIRYCYALGLGMENGLKLQPPFGREELEENKRLWWAITLLER